MKTMEHRPLRFLICSIGLSLLGQLSVPLRAAQPGEAFADFTADGGWCWFSNPRAVSRDGKTCSGWVTEDGTVQAAELDQASGRVTTVNLHEQYQRDDHDNPAFVFLPDGRLMAFYSRHGGGPSPAIHSRTTVRPGDFSEWTPEVALPIRDDSGGTSGISYCNPHLLSEENNTLYLFWRGLSFKPTMSKSIDGGKTWTPAQVVFSRPGLPIGNRPYAQYASNGKDRIHFLFTDGHPRNEAQNSVYYACYRNGAFYKADGTRICGINELPFSPEQADCIYDARKTGVRAWVWDLAFDQNNNPVVAYTRLPAEDDHRYHYARWDGKQWQDTELCAGGKWFPQTPSGKKEPEPHYSSGLSLDHSDPSVVYLSRPVNGVREIERWTTADGGKSWKSEAVTANSKFDNIRPVVVRDHATDGPTVLWMNLIGRYIHFTNFRTAVKMDRPAKTAIIAPAPQDAGPVPSAECETLRTGTPGALKCEGAVADVFKVGAVLFADRKYTVAECPAALQGMSLLRVPVDGKKTLTCVREGRVWVLTPSLERKKDVSQAEALLKQGFKPVALPEFLLFTGDPVTLYQKDCAAGEAITFGRWALPLMLGATADAIAAPAPVPAGPPLSGAVAPQAILAAMERVADWQLANPSKHRPTDWTQGAGYTGIMALAGISKDPKYFDAMLQVGESNQWKLGPSKYFADDHAVGQTYVELWQHRHEDRMIQPMRAQFDEVLASPPDFATLEFKQKGVNGLWSWCDSLFMAPPAWMRLWAATGDKRYLDFAVANWWRTSDYLYDNTEHLYFRDSTYFDRRETNGAKIFWGRGNGWVMGGLVRMLQYLPQDHPDRVRFETQFKEMAEKILSCQQPDGLWRSSLLDPASYPLKETSGSGFYTYALAWGVNQGLLDRATYEPAVHKAWAALVECVAPDGKLTHVQPIGGDPKTFDADATEVYAVGAFLLAGSEVYRLAALEKFKPSVVTVSNPANFSRACETVEVDDPGKSVVVMEGLTSRILDSQVIGDKLLFQVDLAPKETRRYFVLDAGQLAAIPTPAVKTFARFVPERMDDFAWESDRIAHRMYGPALIKKEGTTSSGVDVWVKSTRNLILNKWYAAKNYHTDSGEGLDCYSVSHGKVPTRGCGGLGIWDGKRLFVSSNFSAWKVIATGPIRSVFELAYDAWDAGGRKVTEVKRISIDAGSNFSRVESTFTANGPAPLTIGVGIAKRDGEECVTRDLKAGWLAYWEPVQGKNGNTACALVFPAGVKEFTNDEANLLAIAQAKPGQPFVHYLGAGWSKSGDFPDSSSWNDYVRKFALGLKSPLVIR